MSNTQFSLFEGLSLKTKKQRQKKYQFSKILSESEIKGSLQDMIKAGMKNVNIVQFIKTDLLDEKVMEDNKARPRRIRSQAQEDVIKEIQDKNFDYFIETMETKHFKRKIDQVINNFQSKYTSKDHASVSYQPEHFTNPASPTKTKYSKFSRDSNFSKIKVNKKLKSLPQKQSFQIHKILTSTLDEAKRKRANTFLFHETTKKPVRKAPVISYELECQWQDQLAQNINTIQGTKIRNKKNLKVDRQKLSNYIKSKFFNDVITNYYKFEASENFSFLKNVVESLSKLGEKQLKLISFFTYDINQDGFICEEDIYFFVTRLPNNSKMLADFNIIVDFLRKNQLRSNYTNLPEKLLKWRHKTQFNSLTQPNTSITKTEKQPKLNSFTQKLFTVSKNSERDFFEPARDQKIKKFQINFQVFSLIFSEKMPVLVSQLISSLLEPVKITEDPVQPLEVLKDYVLSRVQSKQKEWAKRMNKTKQILLNFKKENKIFSQKIE